MEDYSRWYHRIEIEPGKWIGGTHTKDVQKQFALTHVPDDLAGKHVLDIGCFDGVFSFGAMQRGAIVLATDVQDKTDAFKYLERHYSLYPRYANISVYNFDKGLNSTFDHVLFYGVYYHLFHPLQAFCRIYDLLKPGGMVHVEGEVMPQYGVESMCRFVLNEYKNDDTNWFVPNVSCLRDWMIAAGFEEVMLTVEGCRAMGYGVKP